MAKQIEGSTRGVYIGSTLHSRTRTSQSVSSERQLSLVACFLLTHLVITVGHCGLHWEGQWFGTLLSPAREVLRHYWLVGSRSCDSYSV
ncbi:hypothetical protein [Zooshikella harenae]|uniref:Uncharacterized protein n=1 Tax=Zooshikella harenae TaxID=2827238 RepID=A0ABS5ZKS4_9GAMM|nr:hypothetical protein [Zooshikella harenae]MBU2713896.1 hypothetical protein [Zooshikella harenae]